MPARSLVALPRKRRCPEGFYVVFCGWRVRFSKFTPAQDFATTLAQAVRVHLVTARVAARTPRFASTGPVSAAQLNSQVAALRRGRV